MIGFNNKIKERKEKKDISDLKNSFKKNVKNEKENI
jgi:hypothetical protein